MVGYTARWDSHFSNMIQQAQSTIFDGFCDQDARRSAADQELLATSRALCLELATEQSSRLGSPFRHTRSDTTFKAVPYAWARLVKNVPSRPGLADDEVFDGSRVRLDVKKTKL